MVSMYHIFIHSSVDGHLSCFHVLDIVNSAALHIRRPVPFQIIVLSGYMFRSAIAGSCSSSIFVFVFVFVFEDVHTVFFSYYSWGSQGKNTEVVCHSLLQWTMFCQNSPS